MTLRPVTPSPLHVLSGKVVGLRGQVDAIGQIAGGPPVGYVGTVVSLRAALVTSSLILSPVLLLFVYAAQKVRKRAEAVDSVEEQEDTAPVP